MAGSDFTLTGSRLQNATRVNQALEDADVTNWDTANDFIFCAMVETTTHGGTSGTLQLRWRNVTDAGSFAALSGTGELTWSGTTDLANGNAVTSGEAVCTPTSGTTYANGVEREGANDVSTTIAQNEYTEHQWAIDASSAGAGDQYEFEIYDATAGASLGTCAAQITMAAGPASGNGSLASGASSLAGSGLIVVNPFTPEVQHFRIYSDDDGEAASTPLANEDTNYTVDISGGNVLIQYRVMVEETGGDTSGATTDDYSLETSKNSGSYEKIFNTATHGLVPTDASSNLTDGASTTNRATNGLTDGAGSFVAGEQGTNGTADLNVTDRQLTAGNFTEHVYAFTVVAASVSEGDTFDFRIALNAGAPGMTNNVTGRITISSNPAGNGSLDAGSAASAGSGTSSSSGDGSLDSGASSLAATGNTSSSGNGSLDSGDSSLSGSGKQVTGASGSLAANDSTVSGEGASSSSGNGALSAGAALITAEGASSSSGNGSLNAGNTDLSGSGALVSGDILGSGTINSGNSALSADGTSFSSGNGSLNVGNAAVSGSGTSVGIKYGNGNLAAQDSSVSGSGISKSVGNGALVSGNSSVSGSGDTGVTTPAGRLRVNFRRFRPKAQKAA